jgi:hypothetical protein
MRNTPSVFSIFVILNEVKEPDNQSFRFFHFVQNDKNYKYSIHHSPFIIHHSSLQESCLNIFLEPKRVETY